MPLACSLCVSLCRVSFFSASTLEVSGSLLATPIAPAVKGGRQILAESDSAQSEKQKDSHLTDHLTQHKKMGQVQVTIIHRVWTTSTVIAKLEIVKCKHQVSRDVTLTFALEYNSDQVSFFFFCLYSHVLGDFNCSLVDIVPVYIKNMLKDKI